MTGRRLELGSLQTRLLCVLLLVLSASGRLGRAPVFQPVEPSSEAAPLDSFSPPAVALAILNRESQRLLMSYSQTRDELWPIERPQAAGVALPPGLDRSPTIRRTSPPTAARQAIAPMAGLHGQVQQLNLELEERLMLACFESGLRQEFLDGYLRVLTDAPESADAVLWLPQALESARDCGRMEELRDALRHQIRFHRGQRQVQVLQERLRQKGIVFSVDVAAVAR